MNFEDSLKNLTMSAREEEYCEKQKAKELRNKYKIQNNNILNTKEIIESVFSSVQKYYPNANFEPTHDIENGEIIPYVGTFECCFLHFDESKLYKIPYDIAIGFRISFNDDPSIINIASNSIDKPSDYKNYRFELLSILKQSAKNNEFIYSGALDKQLIKEATEKVIIKFLSRFN